MFSKITKGNNPKMYLFAVKSALFSLDDIKNKYKQWHNVGPTTKSAHKISYHFICSTLSWEMNFRVPFTHENETFSWFPLKFHLLPNPAKTLFSISTRQKKDTMAFNIPATRVFSLVSQSLQLSDLWCPQKVHQNTKLGIGFSGFSGFSLINR